MKLPNTVRLTYLDAMSLRWLYLLVKRKSLVTIPAWSFETWCLERDRNHGSTVMGTFATHLRALDPQAKTIEGSVVEASCAEWLCLDVERKDWPGAEDIDLETLLLVLLWLNGPEHSEHLVMLAEGWDERITGDFPIDDDAVIEVLENMTDHGTVTFEDGLWQLGEGVRGVWRPTSIYDRLNAS